MPSSTQNSSFVPFTPTLPAGYVLRDYIIEDVLGQGGFGITYRAREEMTDYPVVIKENYPSTFAYRDPISGELRPMHKCEESYRWALESFEKEARTLRKLPKHTNLVHVTSVFRALNTAYIVMEPIDGKNLAELYPQGSQVEPQLLEDILCKLLCALEPLHKQGIIHRDIKPGNIMLTTAGEPVLIDFGAARPTQGTHTATQIGTRGYAPPEQLEPTEYGENTEHQSPQPHWDLYALGCTCHQLITGYVPVSGARTLSERPELQWLYSSALLASIDKAHEKDPADRWQSAQEWLNALSVNTTPPLLPKTNDEDIVAKAQKLIDSKQYDGVPDMLRPAAESGYADAQNNLGDCYYYGHGVQKDYTKAVEWYQKAANQGNATAQCNLGFCYYYGYGVQQDYKQAVEWYQKAANQGYAFAQYNLGICYRDGHGVQQDYTQAVEWHKKAAEQGYASAQCSLGFCYYNGHGVQQDYKQAVVWYQKAAEQGQVYAQYNLGFCYYYGHGVQQDYKQAVVWYQKAANQGDTDAQCYLGVCYENGCGVQQDYTKAVEWYQKAANQGIASAQYNLGNCYHFGHGVQQDYKQAVEWYQKAANQGDTDAQCYLGVCYENGCGVQQDYTKAVEWYQKAANQGIASAQYNLGNCYHFGHGVQQDYKQAVVWYQKAAEQGQVSAQYNLGLSYRDGHGVSKNRTEAMKWLQKAADQGYEDARKELNRLNSLWGRIFG